MSAAAAAAQAAARAVEPAALTVHLGLGDVDMQVGRRYVLQVTCKHVSTAVLPCVAC
jgi:hypothetical protein